MSVLRTENTLLPDLAKKKRKRLEKILQSKTPTCLLPAPCSNQLTSVSSTGWNWCLSWNVTDIATKASKLHTCKTQWKVTNSSWHKPAAVTLSVPMSIRNIRQLLVSSTSRRMFNFSFLLFTRSTFLQGCSPFPTWCGKESSVFRSLFRRNADKWQPLLYSLSGLSHML